MVVVRFEVYAVDLDPTVGSEIRKTRPCCVVSPDAMNEKLDTVIVAPMTVNRRYWPSRVPCRFKGRNGEIALDHIRAVDRTRLTKKLGRVDEATGDKVLEALQRMFEP